MMAMLLFKMLFVAVEKEWSVGRKLFGGRYHSIKSPPRQHIAEIASSAYDNFLLGLFCLLPTSSSYYYSASPTMKLFAFFVTGALVACSSNVDAFSFNGQQLKKGARNAAGNMTMEYVPR